MLCMDTLLQVKDATLRAAHKSSRRTADLHYLLSTKVYYQFSLYTVSNEQMSSRDKLVGNTEVFIEIIESFGSEGTPGGHLVQPPCSEQGHC